MKLFEKKECCCCRDNYTVEVAKPTGGSKSDGAKIKILGSGCSKCKQLETNALAALEQLGMDTEIDHITDFTQIAAYGVMTTPALVVDGKVVSYGKVLKTEEVISILTQR
ncbi:thioredoxin family protein [Solibaculum mannosilyticum]|uniref:thioredoxin family protein n=1 Tax=Solibaculum mannosilyticum TaxID=2780922 RepID=UPI0007A89B0A|nr:hypothetical protein BN3661_02009 [Eubacteriaceae bacterium CHKCI005]